MTTKFGQNKSKLE